MFYIIAGLAIARIYLSTNGKTLLTQNNILNDYCLLFLIIFRALKKNTVKSDLMFLQFRPLNSVFLSNC